MRSFLRIAIISIPLVFLLLLVLSKKTDIVDDRPVLASTIRPLSMILGSIVGDGFSVVTILPAGASPHTYDPTPSALSHIKDAEVLFTVGHGFDDWSIDLAKSAGIDNRVIVDSGIDLIADDPHYFLSPDNAGIIARIMRDELTRLYPDKKAFFDTNTEDFLVLLANLSQKAKHELAQAGIQNIATFHGAWTYFARDLGLQIAGVFEEYPGKEPTPAYLKEFSENVKNSGVTVIFSEPQFSTVLLAPIAQDLGVTISSLDPEGGATNITRYEDLIMTNVQTIIQANTQQ